MRRNAVGLSLQLSGLVVSHSAGLRYIDPMMKITPIVAAFCLFTSVAVSAQAVSSVAEDAIESAIAAAESAEARPMPASENNSSPQLINFDALQALAADYPPASWVAGEEGTVQYELAVDANGNVTDCDIIESAGHEELDAITCEIAFERGKFTPAIDESGSPVAGVHSDLQIWRKREPEFQGPSTIHVQYTVTAEGEVADCETIELSGEIGNRMRRTLENEPCPGMNRTSRAPYRDEEGNPISRRVDLLMVVKADEIEP